MTKNIFLLIAGIISTVAGLVYTILNAIMVIRDIIPSIQYFFTSVDGIIAFVMIAILVISVLGIFLSGIGMISGSFKGKKTGAVSNIVCIALLIAVIVTLFILNGGFGVLGLKEYIFGGAFLGSLVLDIIGLTCSKKDAE